MSTSVANLPLFLQPWWWDAATGSPDAWDAATVVDQQGQLLAYWPYVIGRHFGGLLKSASPPPFTMQSGPWLAAAPTGTKAAKSLSRQWSLTEELLKQLPQLFSFKTKVVYGFTNGMPLQRAGWRQQTRYSYQLPCNQSPYPIIEQGFSSATRQQIRKAQAQLQIIEGAEVDLLLQLIKGAYQVREPRPKSFPAVAFQRLYTAAAVQQASVSWQALGNNGQVHAALWLAFDNTTAYAILPAADPTLRQSGAMSLLLAHAIQWASQQNLIFDFEGSSIPGVEEFYRGFGPVPTPYYQFQKSRW